MLFWLFFGALVFGYCMGAATVYLHQWIVRRSIRAQKDEEDEGYTLRVVRSPGDDYDVYDVYDVQEDADDKDEEA